VTDFHRLFTAAVLSKLGTAVGALAVPLVAVLTLDVSPGQLGALAALGTAASLVVGLPAGAWLDRTPKRPVLVGADLARAALLGSIPLAWALDALTLGQLYVVVLLTGAATVLFDIAAQSYLPHVVGRAGLVAANARLSTVDAAAEVGARAAGGWLVQLLTAPLAVAVDAVSYLWSAAWLVRLRAPEPVPVRADRPPLVAQVREGLSFVLQHPVLRAVLTAGALTNLGIALALTMLPLMLVRELGQPEAVLGLFLAGGGVGLLLGAATARPVSARLGEGRSLWLIGLAAVPVAVLLPLVGTTVPVWAAGIAWAGLTYKIGYDNVLLISFRQQVTPDALLGRVNASVRVLLIGAVTVGSALSGVLGELAGPRAPLWAAAAALALVWLPVRLSPLHSARSLVPATVE
jgi:hypothetical protein